MNLDVVSMTALIALSLAWFSAVLALVLDLSRRQPLGPARWIAPGSLALSTGGILDLIVHHYRHAPPNLVSGADILQLVLGIAGIACAVIAIAVWRRSQRPKAPTPPSPPQP